MMISSFFTLHVFFRILNFGLLVILLIYCFNKYVYPWAMAAIVSRKKQLAFLQKQKRSLNREVKDLINDIQEQKNYGVKVSHLIETWKTRLDKDMQERLQRKQDIVAAAEQRLKAQGKWLASHDMQQHVVPIVLKETKNELESYFSDKKHGAQFVTELASYLRSKAKHETQ